MEIFINKLAFLKEIKRQCDFSIYAVEKMENALNNDETENFWFYTQSLLSACANISKILWGTKKTYNNREGIRRALSVKDDSILKSRKVRNAFEHFDEKIEEFVTGKSFFIDSNIGTKEGVFNHSDNLRFFDLNNNTIEFKGDSFQVETIYHAIVELKASVESEYSSLIKMK